MITSPSNNRIKEARKLQRRRERYAQQQVMIEGVRLVRDAWHSGIPIYTVFYAPEMVDGSPAAVQLLTQLDETHIELVPCSASVFDSLSETVTPQGIAALIAMPLLSVPAHPSLTLLLDQIRDPGNAGTLLRSAAAAGVDLVLFGPETVDPYNEKVMRAGMGAQFRLPIRSFEHWEEADRSVNLAHPFYLADASGEVEYDEIDWRMPSTLVVGGEAEGAGEWVRSHAIAVTIPMERATESLNAAVAASVILFEAARQRRQSRRSTT